MIFPYTVFAHVQQMGKAQKRPASKKRPAAEQQDKRAPLELPESFEQRHGGSTWGHKVAFAICFVFFFDTNCVISFPVVCGRFSDLLSSAYIEWICLVKPLDFVAACKGFLILLDTLMGTANRDVQSGLHVSCLLQEIVQAVRQWAKDCIEGKPVEITLSQNSRSQEMFWVM